MKFDDVEVGMVVCDRWWFWRVGAVTYKGKTIVKVTWQSNAEPQTYDRAHCQFLQEVKR
jgi:hypothetical protein